MPGLLNIGSRALTANYTVLQTIGNNISNANTPGYSRQSVDLTNEGGNFTGGGFIGRGVKVQTISRAYNSFLNSEAGTAASQASASQSRYERLQQLENLFPVGEAGIGYAAGQFFNAFVDVANDPTSLSARQVVLGRGEELGSKFREASDQLGDMRNGVAEDLGTTVRMVNNLADQVARINQEVARLNGSGHTPNDLLDQRDQLVREIGEHIQVSTVLADDGTLGVFVAGGQRLVLSNQTAQLGVGTDALGGASVTLTEAGQTRTLDEDSISGGSIAGLLKFQNQDLNSARGQLETLATAIVNAVNAQQDQGLTLRTPAAVGPALFAQASADPLNVSLAISDPRDIAAASLTAATPASNNENALAFAKLGTSALVDGENITNAYAKVMTDIGVRVNSAKIHAETTGATAQQTESIRTAYSGVNLDEEAAKLIQFQQAYQAAAKVLQIAQTIFQNVLDIGA